MAANNHQHCQHWFMGFWCKLFWVVVYFNFDMRGFYFILKLLFVMIYFPFIVTLDLQNVQWISLHFFYNMFHESMSWMLIELG